MSPPGGTPLKHRLALLAVLAAIFVASSTRVAAEPPANDAAKPADAAKASEPKPKYQQNDVDKGDTAWMLISTALVMFMVPGLALFYGGIVRRKNLLGTMMHSMVA